MCFTLDGEIFIDNDIFAISLTRGDIQYILDFVLLWNLYELKICNKFFRKEKINDYITGIDSEEINNIFDYFRNRYLNDEQKFKNLNLRTDAERIKNNLDNEEEKEYTVIFIIQRYRNNMFHGEKNIQFIENQKSNFEHANNFLRYILSRYN